MVQKRPVIGIAPHHNLQEDTYVIRNNYIQAIVDAGGTPLILPLTRDMSIYEELFPKIDGFLLIGGTDINPARYGVTDFNEKVDAPLPNKEEVECLILSYAYQFDIPLLGICRGMQMINVFFGGTLYLDLADQFSSADEVNENIAHWQEEDFSKPTHFVDIVRASKLGEIFQTEQLATNSMHHQGVKDVAEALNPVAYGPDGLVEAIEVKDRNFMIGVQWHPEFFAGKKHMGCIFTSLVQEASKTMRRQRSIDSGTSRTHHHAGNGCPAASCEACTYIPGDLHISKKAIDEDELWPSITFADYI